MTTVPSAVSIGEFDALDAALPEGFTAELIDGRAIVNLPPVGDHDENVIFLANQTRARMPEMRLYQARGSSSMRIATAEHGRTV